MNIRDLNYVCAVARLGHFGKAAQACHVSQPALSNQIKKLEDELGVTLFERDNRSVRITKIGREIVDLAQQALSVVDSIYATAQIARDPYSGPFSLGSIPTIAPYLISRVIRQSRDVFPKLQLRFREDITDRLNATLLTGELDAAILATPPTSSKLDFIPLYDEPFWVVFPAMHTLERISSLQTRDLPVDELLLLSEGHCFRDQAMDVCQLSGVPEMRMIRATSLETLINLVSAGQGITLIPAMAMGENIRHAPGVGLGKLDDPSAYRRVYLTFRRSFPRKALLSRLSELICADLPKTVQTIVKVNQSRYK